MYYTGILQSSPGSPNGITERIVTIRPRFDPLGLQGPFSDRKVGDIGDVATPETPTSSLRNRPEGSGGLLRTAPRQSCKKGV